MKKVLYSRRGDINFSLSWVFMIIVGTFFLMLAYNVVTKYQSNEEAKYQIELKNTLRTIFNDVGRTTGTEKNSLVKLGNVFKDSEVEVLCVDGMSILSVNENLDANNDYLKSYPVFMTYIQQGKVENTYLAVENLKLPFKITNLLALVSKKNLIVFDSSSEIGKELGHKFQKTSYDELNFVMEDFSVLNVDSFKDEYLSGKGISTIVFVTDSLLGSSLSFSLADFKEESYFVIIDQMSSNSGVIEYHDAEENVKSFNYVDYDNSLALPSMAVFSRPETFECSYEMVFKSIESVYDFYINKTNYYIGLSEMHEVVCVDSFEAVNQQIYYEELRDILIEIKNEVKKEKFNNIEIIMSSIEMLNSQYLNLERYNCPYIY